MGSRWHLVGLGFRNYPPRVSDVNNLLGLWEASKLRFSEILHDNTALHRILGELQILLNWLQQIVDLLIIYFQVGHAQCCVGLRLTNWEQILKSQWNNTAVYPALTASIAWCRLGVIFAEHGVGFACTRDAVSKYGAVDTIEHVVNQGHNCLLEDISVLRVLVKYAIELKSMLLCRIAIAQGQRGVVDDGDWLPGGTVCDF